MEYIGGWYVSQKIRRVRWLRDPNEITPQDTQYVATGTYDENRNSISLWKLDISQQGRSQEPELLSSTTVSGFVTELKSLYRDRFYLLSSFSKGPWEETKRETFSPSSQAGGAGLCLYKLNTHTQSLETETTWRGLHRGAVTCFDCDDSGRVVTGGEDGKINFFRLERTSTVEMEIANADSMSINAIRFTAPSTVISVSSSEHFRIWDLREPQKRKVLKEGNKGIALHCLHGHPHQPSIFATGSSDGCVSIWDIRMENFPIHRSKGHSSNVWEVLFHPSHPNYLFSCSSDGRVLLWDFQASRDNSKPIFSVDKDSVKVYELIRQESLSPINSIDYEPATKSIICAADNEYLAIRTSIEVF